MILEASLDSPPTNLTAGEKLQRDPSDQFCRRKLRPPSPRINSLYQLFAASGPNRFDMEARSFEQIGARDSFDSRNSLDSSYRVLLTGSNMCGDLSVTISIVSYSMLEFISNTSKFH